MLWVDGHKSSYFLLVKMSSPTKWTWIGIALVVAVVVAVGTNLGVSVLASLAGAHLHDFAGAAFDHDIAVLAKGRALDRVGGRGSGWGPLVLGFIVFHLSGHWPHRLVLAQTHTLSGSWLDKRLSEDSVASDAGTGRQRALTGRPYCVTVRAQTCLWVECNACQCLCALTAQQQCLRSVGPKPLVKDRIAIAAHLRSVVQEVSRSG